MSQRISLQYSIPLDNLKDEVERLLSSAYGMAHTLGENCNNSSTGAPLTLQTLHEIEEVRTQLANVDFLLNDITGMINGYLDKETPARRPRTIFGRRIFSANRCASAEIRTIQRR